jgi:hypothetical protein
MSKGTTAMSAIAVLATGGYFAYDYWDSHKAKSKAAAGSTSGGKKPAGSGSGSEWGGSGGRPGSGGSGSGSEAGDEHTATADDDLDGGAVHRVRRLELPSVIGLTPDKAREKLVALGYKDDVLEIPPNMGCSYEDEQRDIVPVGTICNQEREPGQPLMSNAKLRVVIEHDTWEHGGVENEREWHRMPDLVGTPLAAARELLRSKGFSDDEFVVGESRTSCGAGMVCEQRPKPDSRKFVAEPGELNVGN